MINHGITTFLFLKKVDKAKGIKAFLEAQGSQIKFSNHPALNDYIQSNWSKFASFIDTNIKNGTLKGEAIKLNTHFDEERERIAQIIAEKKVANITPEEDKILRKIKKGGIGILKGYAPHGVGKDYSFTSSNMQWLPVVRGAIAAGFKLEEHG
jgi:hypothetical protein